MLVNTEVHVSFELVVWVFLGVCPEEELLGHMITLFLVSLKTPILFFSDCSSSHSHQQCTRLPFLHVHQRYLFVFFFNLIETF